MTDTYLLIAALVLWLCILAWLFARIRQTRSERRRRAALLKEDRSVIAKVWGEWRRRDRPVEDDDDV